MRKFPSLTKRHKLYSSFRLVERDDHIYVGVEVRDVELDEEIVEPES